MKYKRVPIQNKPLINRGIFVFSFIFTICGIILYNNVECGKWICSIIILCLSGILRTYVQKGILEIFSTKNYFLLYFLLLHGIGYYTYQIRLTLGLAVYQHSNILIEHALFVSVLALIVFLIGYNFSHKYLLWHLPQFNNFRIKPVFNQKKIKWILLLLSIVGSTALFWALIGDLPIRIADYHQSARAELGKGLGFIEQISISLINLSLLYIIICVKYKNYGRLFWWYVIIIISIFLLNLDRGALVQYLISLWMIYDICWRKTTAKRFVFIFGGIVLLAGIMGLMRTMKGTNIAVVGGLILTEASVEFDNYVEVFNMTEHNGYLNGSTLVPITTIPIPRAIFPDKDKYFTAGTYFKDYHNHNHIRVGERISYIGELYLNWGILGMIIGMIIIGILMSCVDLNVNNKSIISVYLYIQLIKFFGGLNAGDIATSVTGLIMSNFIILLIFFIILPSYLIAIHEKNICRNHLPNQ